MNTRKIAYQVFLAACALRREAKSFAEIKTALGLKSREVARRAVAAGERLEHTQRTTSQVRTLFKTLTDS